MSDSTTSVPPAQPPAAPETDVRLTEAEREALVRAAVAYYARSRKHQKDPDYLLHSDPASLPVTMARDVIEPLVPAVERIVAERVRVVEGERDAAEAAHRALQAAVEALAADFDSNVDWSAGRNNYGDNEAWESAARQVRALAGGAR